MNTLSGPDGDLNQHRVLIGQLSQQALQARASLDAMKSEQSLVEEARGQLQCGRDRTEGRRRAFRGAAHRCAPHHDGLAVAGRDAHPRAVARGEGRSRRCRGRGREAVEKKLGPLAQLQELSKEHDERLASLNTLADEWARR